MMTIENLRDLCSKARIELNGDYRLGLRNYKDTQDLADKAMIESLELEGSLHSHECPYCLKVWTHASTTCIERFDYNCMDCYLENRNGRK